MTRQFLARLFSPISYNVNIECFGGFQFTVDQMIYAVIVALLFIAALGAIISFGSTSQTAAHRSSASHGGPGKVQQGIDLVINARVIEHAETTSYDGRPKQFVGRSKESKGAGNTSSASLSRRSNAFTYNVSSTQEFIYNCTDTTCSSTIFESFISRRNEDVTILRNCLNSVVVEKQPKQRLILDLRCINRAGNLEPKNYFHNIIDCLIPMAPTLAHVLNLPVYHMNYTFLVTNSHVLRSWISFLTPLFVTTSTVISLPLKRLPSTRIGMDNCLPLIHFLGRRATRSDIKPSNRNIVIFIVRVGSSRDIKNIQELKEITAAVLGPSVDLINFYGHESSKETFQLFQSAQVVVGYHGAGLANVAFCKNSTLAIEISVFMDFQMTKHWRSNSELGILNKGIEWNTIWLPLNATGFTSDEEIMDSAKNRKLDLDHFIKERSVVIPREHSLYVASTIKKFLDLRKSRIK